MLINPVMVELLEAATAAAACLSWMAVGVVEELEQRATKTKPVSLVAVRVT